MIRFFNMRFLFLLVALTVLMSAYGQRFSDRVRHYYVPESQREESVTDFLPGFILVTDSTDSTHSGAAVDSVEYSGYAKPSSSDVETIFIRNLSDRDVVGVLFCVEYLSMSGEQLHKRMVRQKIEIPGGESRKLDFRSWDRQHSFYYYKSSPGRSNSTPYKVRIIPYCYWLKP